MECGQIKHCVTSDGNRNVFWFCFGSLIDVVLVVVVFLDTGLVAITSESPEKSTVSAHLES